MKSSKKMKDKKTILLISFIFSPNIGGVESHLDDLCDYLTKKFNVVVLTCQPLALKKSALYFEKKDSMEIHRIRWFRFSLFNTLESIPILEVLYLVPPMLFSTIWYLWFNKKKIDVIQVHGFNMTIVGSIASFIFRKKMIVNTHVSFNFSKGSIYANLLCLFLHNATKILVLTHAAKNELVKIGIAKSKIVLYHQWIDEKLFNPKNKLLSREKFGIQKNAFVACFAGRFVDAKGVHLLLDAVKKLDKNIVITFVGSGPLMETIETIAKENLQVKLIGRIPRQDLPYYYSASDVSIIPSIQVTQTYSEGIPRVMIEALTCGIPVIATRSGGVIEFINKDIGFFISPTGDSISKMLNNLSQKKNMLKKMRQVCITAAKEEFAKEGNGRIIANSLM